MERLKQWLAEHQVIIVHPGIADEGRIWLLLRTANGREIEVVFDPDELEDDPEDTIEFIREILEARQGL